MRVAKRCFVAGHVQGVFYRASAQQEARNLELIGYAKNLADRRVEVLVAGELSQVEAFIRWLWQGPPSANVTGVDVQEIELQALQDLAPHFVIL